MFLILFWLFALAVVADSLSCLHLSPVYILFFVSFEEVDAMSTLPRLWEVGEVGVGEGGDNWTHPQPPDPRVQYLNHPALGHVDLIVIFLVVWCCHQGPSLVQEFISETTH